MREGEREYVLYSNSKREVSTISTSLVKTVNKLYY